jgi:hypothetical protein
MTGRVAAQPLLLCDLAMKTALAVLLIVALLWPHLPQFEGDGHAFWRAVTYPIILLLVPVGWGIFGHTRADEYPYGLDLLLPLPLVIDTAAPSLYHRIDWWDKFMHVVSWSVLVGASVLVLSWLRLDRALVASLAVGIGMVTAAVWELWEYFVWVRNSPELIKSEYSDTVGDLTCDLVASVLAVAVTLLLVPWWTTRRGRAKLEPSATGGTVESVPSELVGR